MKGTVLPGVAGRRHPQFGRDPDLSGATGPETSDLKFGRDLTHSFLGEEWSTHHHHGARDGSGCLRNRDPKKDTAAVVVVRRVSSVLCSSCGRRSRGRYSRVAPGPHLRSDSRRHLSTSGVNRPNRGVGRTLRVLSVPQGRCSRPYSGPYRHHGRPRPRDPL